MADDADRAGDNIDRFEADAVAFYTQESKRRNSLIPVGRCYYCDEKIDSGIFCGPDCREDWEHEQARKKANGTA